MIYIHCDVRERSLISALDAIISSPSDKTPSPTVFLVKRNLHLGDIILSTSAECDNTGAVALIIERKTVADFLASIKDGRYQEQACRLSALETCHNHNIVYLIEGHYRFSGETERNTFYSAMFSVMFYKGFSLMYAPSVAETAHLIYTAAAKLIREAGKRVPFYRIMNGEGEGEAREQVKQDYCASIKTVKKDNITADNITRIMLMQIPGISATVAAAICSVFPTVGSIVDELRTSPEKLDDIMVNGRKMSKTVKTKLLEYFGTQTNKKENDDEIMDMDMNKDDKDEKDDVMAEMNNDKKDESHTEQMVISIEPILKKKVVRRPKKVPKLLLPLPAKEEECDKNA